MPELTLDDPRVWELDHAAARAYLDLADAIEEAGRRGLPAEVIARYTEVPVAEVEMILKEMGQRR